ncbi:hypothetical protein ACVWYF_003232 [Hymenobacter sp. UYAg731]
MKSLLTLLLLLINLVAFGQSASDKTVATLGKAYRQYMSEEAPSGFAQKQLMDVPDNLKAAAKFITQTITVNNELLKKDYLTLPEEETLKSIYYIIKSGANPDDNNSLLENLKTGNIPRSGLIDNYYTMLFIAVGNKNRPFDMSGNNFILSDYGLKDDTEKDIFFLRCMELCGKMIWGQMHLAKPANTKQGMLLIKKYPKINGAKYFQYTALDFPDFPINIAGETGPQSYKFFYLNKYYDLLLSHFSCLNQEKAPKDDINALVTTSVIKNRSLFKYTTNKAKLESILQEYKL